MNAAAEYADHGFALIPIPHSNKGPAVKGWNLQQNAVTTADDALLLSGNIGIAHAYCRPNPTCALDIDNLQLSVCWLGNRGIDLDALLSADDAVQILSGREGRAKLLYRLPNDVSPMATVDVKGTVEHGKLTILEFRCATSNGLTVQDVLPPSIHPNTSKPYGWGGRGDWRQLPVIPNALLDVWRKELAQRALGRRLKRFEPSVKAVEDTPRQRARVAEMLGHISADCSYELYRDIVWATLSLGWVDAQDIAVQWCKSAPHRFEEDSFEAVVTSYDETRTPSIGTIVFHARAGGWNG